MKESNNEYEIFTGSIKTDLIDKGLFQSKNPKTGKEYKHVYLPISVIVNREADEYGNRVVITTFDPETKEKTYIANCSELLFEKEKTPEKPKRKVKDLGL